MRQILANRSFVNLWCAGLFLQLSWWLLHTSMLVLVYERTGSTLGTGLIPVFACLPSILFGAIAGRLVDRLDRQQVMKWGAGMLSVLMLLALPFAHAAPATLLYAFIFLQAAVMTAVTPAENALLPSLVDTSQLKTANALNVLNDGIGRILGPAIGAPLLVRYGPTAIVVVCLLLYTVAWVCLMAVHAPALRQSSPPAWREIGWLASFREQRTLVSRIIDERTALAVVIGAFALYMVADVPFSAVLPVFVVDSLHAGSEGLGVMLSLRGIAGIAGSLLILVVSRRISAQTLLVSGLLTYGACIAVQGVINTYVPGLFFLILVGPAAAAIQTGMNTLLQQASPEAERGRIFALVGTIGGLVTLGASLVAGGLGELVDVRVIVIAAGCLQLLPAFAIWRGIRSRDESVHDRSYQRS